MSRSKDDGTYHLKNLDLSEMTDCSNLDFDGYTLENVIFSRFIPSKPEKKLLFRLSFMGAELKQVSFAQAHIVQCNFDTMDKEAVELHAEKIKEPEFRASHPHYKETTLHKVDFFFSDLDFCRFRNTIVNTADFRYTHIQDCTMSECKVTLGDFYFCAFQGCTSFVDAVFYHSSFTCATFENNCIRMSNIPDGIVQEHVEIYHNNLIHAEDWMKYNPCASFSSMNHEANKTEITDKSKAYVALEAANFYRELSGTFTGKGLNHDSNEAYRKSKLCELDYYKICLRLTDADRKDCKCSLHCKIFWIRLIRAFGFGYKWWPPTLWFVGMTLLYAGIAEVIKYNPVHPIVNFIRHWCNSLYNSMSPHEDFSKLITLPWASFESVAGVLLIGFLGFIIANNIRNDS